MYNKNIRALQLCELQMLKDVTDMCDKNDIAYFLDSGTLLGAIRHGGFIPWDDDVDIGMDTENYKKFCKIAPKKLGKQYFVQNYNTDVKLGISWSRVRINGTTSMERDLVGYDIHQGICMDIFEYVGFPTGIKARIAKVCNELKHLLLVKYFIEVKNESVSAKMKILYSVMGWEPARRWMINLLDRIAKTATYKSEYCYSSWSTNFTNSDVVKYPSKYLKKEDLIKVKFEDAMFWAPKEYEKILKLQYGNWKELPPEGERGGHGDIIVDLNKDYKEYF